MDVHDFEVLLLHGQGEAVLLIKVVVHWDFVFKPLFLVLFLRNLGSLVELFNDVLSSE